MSLNFDQNNNIHNNLNLDHLISFLREENPDIISLQNSIPKKLLTSLNPALEIATELGYDIYLGPERQKQTSSISILTKYPIISLDYIIFESTEFPSENSLAAHLGIFTGLGILEFYSIQLESENENEINEQLDEFFQFIDETDLINNFSQLKLSSNFHHDDPGSPGGFLLNPKVIIGNFPFENNSDPYNKILKNGFFDAWVEAENVFNLSNSFSDIENKKSNDLEFFFISELFRLSISSFRVIKNEDLAQYSAFYFELASVS